MVEKLAELPSGEIGLILAAERLFAERGIDAVALRQVNQAAKQRNMSAAHYHFGSRDGLVRAVLMYRWPELDRRRGEMLSKRAGKRDLRFYLEAFVLPLLEELKPRREGNYYIRFMQQYERIRDNYDFARQLSPASVEIYDQIERLIAYLPDQIRRLRIGYLINMIHSILAITEERLGRGEVEHGQIELIGANLIDMCACALTGPISEDSLALLSSGQGRVLPGSSWNMDSVHEAE